MTAQIEVGTGATQICYSDRHAFTVVEVLSPTRLRVRQDKAVRTDDNGMSSSQSYDYVPNPQGTEAVISLRKSKHIPEGVWVEVGFSEKEAGCRFHVGSRREYHDYSF